MISPELLRRFPFFAHLTEEQLASLAMIGEEVEYPAGQIIVEECEVTDALYLLTEGTADIYFTIQDDKTNTVRHFVVGEITTGDPFGISALIEPYEHSSSVRAQTACKAIKLDAVQLRELVDQDPTLAKVLLKQIVKAALDRLNNTRVQLAAAWA
ncbi:MAG: cyclic nucleotide-binding domain-containing protein [Anaerolineales bacterium]|nr:cyclic nucleotide-binding domain-containing protein [Anaerolineales bacterium]